MGEGVGLAELALNARNASLLLVGDAVDVVPVALSKALQVVERFRRDDHLRYALRVLLEELLHDWAKVVRQGLYLCDQLRRQPAQQPP